MSTNRYTTAEVLERAMDVLGQPVPGAGGLGGEGITIGPADLIDALSEAGPSSAGSVLSAIKLIHRADRAAGGDGGNLRAIPQDEARELLDAAIALAGEANDR